MADGVRHTKLSHQGTAQAMSTRGRREGRQSRVAIRGGGLAGYRCNIDNSAVCLADCCCSMLIRGCSAVCCLFFLQSAKKAAVVLWGLGHVTAPHGHRTARPTHALHNAPRWRRLILFAWLPQSTEPTHMHSSSSSSHYWCCCTLLFFSIPPPALKPFFFSFVPFRIFSCCIRIVCCVLIGSGIIMDISFPNGIELGLR